MSVLWIAVVMVAAPPVPPSTADAPIRPPEVVAGRAKQEAPAGVDLRNAVRAARNPSRAKGNYGLFLSKQPERILEAVRLLEEARDAHPDWDEVGLKLQRLLEAAD